MQDVNVSEEREPIYGLILVPASLTVFDVRLPFHYERSSDR
jgi:hypothetical protein